MHETMLGWGRSERGMMLDGNDDSCSAARPGTPRATTETFRAPTRCRVARERGCVIARRGLVSLMGRAREGESTVVYRKARASCVMLCAATRVIPGVRSRRFTVPVPAIRYQSGIFRSASRKSKRATPRASRNCAIGKGCVFAFQVFVGSTLPERPRGHL